MDAGFDEEFKSKLDNATIKDLMPGYNKEEDWGLLSRRLKPGKIMPFPLWLSHAAAILVGVVISWLFLKEFAAPKTIYKPQVVIKETVKKTVVYDTVIVQATPQTAIAFKNIPAHKEVPATKLKETIPEHTEPDNNSTPSTIQTPPVIAAMTVHASRPQAINLLDINNEDKEVLLQDLPVMKTRERVITYFTARIYPPVVQPERNLSIVNLFNNK